jgi:PIN domain nuclease of toxin-antitoxin system
VKILVDAHALIWAVDDPSKLGLQAARVLQDGTNDLFLGAGTIWEISIKVSLAKLSLSLPYQQWMNRAITDLGIRIVPITVAYANAQANLPMHHRDPFDRLMVAQAIVERFALISTDSLLDQYGINRIW